MKKSVQSISVLIISLLAFSCMDKIKDTYLIYEPVYLNYQDLREPVQAKSGQDIIQPGKLYFKDHQIYINEYMAGIHVVDNEDPSNPQVLKFIEIPGNVDLAIKGNILYADSYVDLVALDISDLENIREVGRVENAFPYLLPEYADGPMGEINEQEGIVVGWQLVEKTEEVEHVNTNYGYYKGREDVIYYANTTSIESSSGGGESEFGVGGSMARFTLYSDYLYTIDYSKLRLFNISESENPVLENESEIGWDIETIFPYNQKLFIGTQTGMLIYGLSDPSNPEYISEFDHARGCDPVVVEGNYAYVTLRAGNLCGNTDNQLDIIDISNIHSPRLLKEYPMTEPYGLGIDDSVLFVCDGIAGLKIYNASDPMNIINNKLIEYPEINSFDVIPLGDVLLMIGSDGLYQYDYSDLDNISQLSFIPIYTNQE